MILKLSCKVLRDLDLLDQKRLFCEELKIQSIQECEIFLFHYTLFDFHQIMLIHIDLYYLDFQETS